MGLKRELNDYDRHLLWLADEARKANLALERWDFTVKGDHEVTATATPPTSSLFRPATKKETKARIGLVGPSGSGKTFTALRIALGLGGRIALIDTENRTASKYVGEEVPEGIIEFDVMELETFSPDTYVMAVTEAARLGYDTVIIDSLSHAWMGKSGALEQVDNAKARSGGNAFAAWRHITPMHNEMVDALIRAPMHVIVTMRAKTQWVVEQNENGKSVPRKIGLAPVQRDGLEYEFDIVADLDHENNFIVSKSRCRALKGKVIREAGGDIAQIVRDWLTDGTAPDIVTADQTEEIRALADELSFDEDLLIRAAREYGAAGIEFLTTNQAAEMIVRLTAKKNGGSN